MTSVKDVCLKLQKVLKETQPIIILEAVDGSLNETEESLP